MTLDIEYMGQALVRCLTYDPQQPMIFNSSLFLFLFAGFSLVYALLNKHTLLRLAFVTLFSYYFYYKSSGFYFALLLTVTLSDFLLAMGIQHTRQQWGRRMLLALSIIIDLGFLGYYKYANFFGQLLADIAERNFQPADIFLPVGISFFTFQSLSYTIDVYRGQIRALRNPLDYAFYVSFFPQLVAGPIVRARDFIPQIRQPLMVTQEMFGRGLYLIMAGLLKKAVISDYISLNYVDRIFDNPSLYTGTENLLGIYGYTLQIYCDFSGYSDMAIGIALLLGFHFPLNFDAPYRSDSITDFWRRWHISLSSWLRDYLYISLGGNRHGQIRTYINLLLTMLLGGLWHGASINFIVWGGLHGLALAVDKATRRLLHLERGYHPRGLLRVIAVIVTFHFVAFCWIFFRNTTFDATWAMLTQIATALHPEILPQVLTAYPIVFSLIALGYVMHYMPDSLYRRAEHIITRTPLWIQGILVCLCIYLFIQVKSSDIQPFIYFQF